MQMYTICRITYY